MLGPLINALTPYLPGIMELPEAHGAFAWGLAKGRIHKYIKRVPKPGGGYRYYYSAAHGGTVAHVEHFVEGASFKDPEGHWHIKSKDGDTLHLRHDETGEERKMTHAQLAEHLTSLHGASIKQAREAAAAALAEARGAGASKKQIARLEERAKRLGVDVLKESQRAAFSEHKRTTGEFHPWDPAERTPPKASDGVEYVRAPAGGATSEVDGKFYRGGQLMPIHGKFSGQERFKSTGEGDVASRRADDEGDGPARRRYTEEDIARGLAEAKERKAVQSLRDGVFGRFLHPGKLTRNFVAVDHKKWREFASEIGPAKMGAVVRALESAYAKIPSVEAHAGAAEYDFGRLKEVAGLTKEAGGVRVERNVPWTHYAHQLMTSMINGHDKLGANELESAVKLNEIIGGAIA